MRGPGRRSQVGGQTGDRHDPAEGRGPVRHAVAVVARGRDHEHFLAAFAFHLPDLVEGRGQGDRGQPVRRPVAQGEVEDLSALPHRMDHRAGQTQFTAHAVGVQGPVDVDVRQGSHLFDDPGDEGSVARSHVQVAVAPCRQGVEGIDVLASSWHPLQPSVLAELFGDPCVDDPHGDPPPGPLPGWEQHGTGSR
ncbi:MAG: hypothetical protein QG608_575 [Actinomycetota bacterium]|nr:hypothetical protein [Actinomycetota bacterium]